MAHTPTKNVYWVDLLSGAGAAEISPVFPCRFADREFLSAVALIRVARENPVLACMFEFDYPDRRSLDTFARFKEDFPSVPVVMVTLRRSETLAKWAFRSGVLDFLVHPLSDVETDHCIRSVEEMDAARDMAGNHVMWELNHQAGQRSDYLYGQVPRHPGVRT